MALPDDVRAHAAVVAAGARRVRIDAEALERLDVDAARDDPAPDPRHLRTDDREVLAAYVLTLNAINFGSGWFPTLRKRPESSGYWTVAWALTDRFHAHGPWSPAELRAMTARELATVLDQPVGHQLMALYADALRALGRWLGEWTPIAVIDAAGGSAVRLAEGVARMPFYRDRGLYKRAQILGADVAGFGLAAIHDLDRLTMFADNLVPHVLRGAGVLRYDDDLAA
ncbi:MAG: queuosine salvage family protein, partial [Solirubrobacteraceae bacterium]